MKASVAGMASTEPEPGRAGTLCIPTLHEALRPCPSAKFKIPTPHYGILAYFDSVEMFAFWVAVRNENSLVLMKKIVPFRRVTRVVAELRFFLRASLFSERKKPK